MYEFDVISRINELCASRSWSYYRLVKESGIAHSTLISMLHTTNVPTIPSLIKICNGFGITLAQFFSPEDEISLLTKDQKDCLQRWNSLDDKSKMLALAYMQALSDRQ